jgi:hypothetical protein
VPVTAIGLPLASLLLLKRGLQCFLVALNRKTKQIAPSSGAFASALMLARDL